MWLKSIPGDAACAQCGMCLAHSTVHNAPFFFFPSRSRHTRCLSDWSSDVCSSDLPGAYEKLAAFANKNNFSVWGQRAALALGYDDYSKSHAQQALTWLQKAKPDTLLYEYTLFWADRKSVV